MSPYIRSFHLSTLPYREHSLNTERLYSSSNAVWNPISHGKSVGRPLGCAGREVRVGAVRVRMTFLWMSDLTFAYFDLKAL